MIDEPIELGTVVSIEAMSRGGLPWIAGRVVVWPLRRRNSGQACILDADFFAKERDLVLQLVGLCGQANALVGAVGRPASRWSPCSPQLTGTRMAITSARS